MLDPHVHPPYVTELFVFNAAIHARRPQAAVIDDFGLAHDHAGWDPGPAPTIDREQRDRGSSG
jgi:hypothetical protein